MKIRKIEREQFDGKVYNFGTEDTHTYVAEGVVVHNCYQNSTLAGKHARMKDIRAIARACEKAEVFEVAIGGGEPTLHPEFIELLYIFADSNVVPNFTTKNPKWIAKNWLFIKDVVGGFAVSVTSEVEIHHLAQTIKGLDFGPGQVNLHFVMGLNNREQFDNMLRAAREYGYRVTLLGYKTFGRGNEVQPENYDWWLDSIFSTEGLDISIDTALALQYHQQILDAGVPQYMFHTTEGRFSAYVDAVAMTLHPSSYDEEQSYDFNGLTWLTNFAKF